MVSFVSCSFQRCSWLGQGGALIGSAMVSPQHADEICALSVPAHAPMPCSQYYDRHQMFVNGLRGSRTRVGSANERRWCLTPRFTHTNSLSHQPPPPRPISLQLPGSLLLLTSSDTSSPGACCNRHASHSQHANPVFFRSLAHHPLQPPPPPLPYNFTQPAPPPLPKH